MSGEIKVEVEIGGENFQVPANEEIRLLADIVGDPAVMGRILGTWAGSRLYFPSDILSMTRNHQIRERWAELAQAGLRRVVIIERVCQEFSIGARQVFNIMQEDSDAQETK